jgi:hypothetical protein
MMVWFVGITDTGTDWLSLVLSTKSNPGTVAAMIHSKDGIDTSRYCHHLDRLRDGVDKGSVSLAT